MMLSATEPSGKFRYGLGSARSLSDFEAYCGVDFGRKTIAHEAIHRLIVS
jgi:hypothetical protein